jgi:hypothetical protein
MLLLSAFLSIVMGLFVALFGQDKNVKRWLILLCINVSFLTAGLWVEVNSPAFAVLAARIVMSSALVGAAMALMCARIMCNLTLRPWVVGLLLAAALLNLLTVWLTSSYFTGTLYRYTWGYYVSANPRFILNPILVFAIAVYTLLTLGLHYRAAHPLDRNRTHYIFVANLFLALASLDYLPHFGIALIGGLISGLVIPIFLGIYWLRGFTLPASRL